MFVCYYVFKSYVIEKLCLCVLLSKTSVTNALCSFVTLSSSPVSLRTYVSLLSV